MKKTGLLILACVFIVSMSGLAQEQAPQHMRKGEKKEFKEGEKPMMTPQQRAEKMAKELSLTDVEKAKVQALFEKEDLNRKNNQADAQKKRDELKTKFEKERKAHDAELESIIGKDKFQKLVTMRQEKMNRMKERKEKMMNDSTFHGKKHMKEDMNM